MFDESRMIIIAENSTIISWLSNKLFFMGSSVAFANCCLEVEMSKEKISISKMALNHVRNLEKRHILFFTLIGACVNRSSCHLNLYVF